MLAGLRHDALVRRDDEHHEIDAARAGRHRADEPLVPGDIHHARHGAVGQRQVREPELDRDLSASRFSSRRRSVSIPVSARTSEVLP